MIEKYFSKSPVVCCGIAALALLTATGLSYVLWSFNINVLNAMALYLLAVILVATFTRGILYSLTTNALSLLLFDFLYVEPQFSFLPTSPAQYLTFLLMLTVGGLICVVTYRQKQRVTELMKIKLDSVKISSDAEKEHMKAMLLRSVSHDLRTPLTAIHSGLEWIQKGGMTKEQQDETVSILMQKTDWTIRLVENLLALTRIDNVCFSVKKTPEVVEEIVPQAIRNVSSILGNRRVEVDIPREPLLVPMDGTLIIQVISNIMNNGVRYTGDNGVLRVTVRAEGDYAVFVLYNNGSKISDDVLGKIFEMYFTTSDNLPSGNMGMGLPICKTIVTAHKGSICAYNVEYGVEFKFALPLKEDTNEGKNTDRRR